MKKTILLLLVIMLTPPKGYADFYNDYEPKDNEVLISFNCVEMPLNKILLIRKSCDYCALKFMKLWTEKDGNEKYAAYRVYYQSDGTGNFSKDVIVNNNVASELPLKGPFRPFIYQPGDSFVKCGPYKLTWNYKKKVGTMPPNKGLGDFGFELAPTPWTNIKEVNVKDPRINWYRYNNKRERIIIPIDKLWKEN